MNVSKTMIAKQKKEDVLRTVRGFVDYRPRPNRKAIKLIDDYLSKTDPNDVDLLLLKGNILDILLEYDQSVHIYSKVLRIEPQNARALIDMGDVYSNKDAHRKAIPYYDRALRLIELGRNSSGLYSHFNKEDDFVAACVGKAEALLELNKPMEALKCIVQGLQKYPADILLADALERAQKRFHSHHKTGTRKRKKNIGK